MRLYAEYKLISVICLHTNGNFAQICLNNRYPIERSAHKRKICTVKTKILENGVHVRTFTLYSYYTSGISIVLI